MESNDINIFNEIFEKKERLVRFAQYYVGDQAVAEDLVMDSFMYYWENRSKVSCNGNMLAYIVTVVKHKSLDYLKQLKIHSRVHDEIKDDAEWELNMGIATLEAFDPYKELVPDNIELVNNAISELPERTRQIFLMSRQDNMTYKEIAYAYGMSEKNVEYHISKALKILRKELKEYFPLIFFLSFFG